MVRPIKYYNLVQTEEFVSGTCYDGTRQFTKPLSKRLYPDEYLIADILEKYLQQNDKPTDKEFFVVKEPWKGNGGTRSGGMNVAIADEILKIIESNPSTDGLILAPFLFHYHHPGITIDLKNKVAIYLDPYGSEPYDLPDLQKLKSALLAKGFNFLVVKAEQQQRGKDGSSCGPILTASMMKFIDEFLATGSITTEFKAPRRTLATDRMAQMNIRNPKNLAQISDATVNEIGLADIDLWKCFFNEQGFKDKQSITAILHIIKEQKKFMHRLPLTWENDQLILSQVEFIIDFQLKLANVILAKDKSPEEVSSLIAELVGENKVILGITSKPQISTFTSSFFKSSESNDDLFFLDSSADTESCVQGLMHFFADLITKAKDVCSSIALAIARAAWVILKPIIAIFVGSSEESTDELEELQTVPMSSF